MESEQEEIMEIEGIQLSDDMLFYGSTRKLEELIILASKHIEEIEQTDNVRLIVLETWLFVDYCIRELLMSGMELSRFNIESYDLRFKLLPKSFMECINIIVRLKEVHSDLPRDPDDKAIKLPAVFLFFIKKNYPEFFNNFLEIEQEYYRQHATELVKKDPEKIIPPLQEDNSEQVEYSRISLGWLKAVSRIDDVWVKSAKKLNEARNYAAHSYDSEQILKRMGYSGNKAIDQVKNECKGLLNKLIGITKSISDKK